MVMKKFNLFANDNNDSNIEEIKDEKNIINKELIGYILNEFPDVATNIKEALNNLGNTLEESIDYIEDKSSVIVKEARDFKLSNKYRKSSIELHEIAKNIYNYIIWMEENKKEVVTVEKTTNEEVKADSASDVKKEDCIQVIEGDE